VGWCRSALSEGVLTIGLMNLWLEVVQLASTITFSDDADALIWKFTSNGVYFLSLYIR